MKKICFLFAAIFLICILGVSCAPRETAEGPSNANSTASVESVSQTADSLLLAPNRMNKKWRAEEINHKLMCDYTKLCSAFDQSEKDHASDPNSTYTMSKSELCQSLDRLSDICCTVSDAYYKILKNHIQQEEQRRDMSSSNVKTLDNLLAQYDDFTGKEVALEGDLQELFFSGSIGAPVRQADTRFSLSFQKMKLLQSLCAYMDPTPDEWAAYDSVIQPILQDK